MNDRILIAGTNSGCGKTTVTLALLASLKARGLTLSAFKCGPDYIDPMFHRKALGLPSRNLDPFFSDGPQLCSLLGQAKSRFSVIEGVMGYYDGVGKEGAYSTYTVAQKTQTPVILVINAAGMQTSAAAVIRGFRLYRAQSGLTGVIFNNASPMTYAALADLARSEGLMPLGFLPRCGEIAVGSRYLGLLTVDEVTDIQDKLTRLGDFGEQYLSLDEIISLGAAAPPLSPVETPEAPMADVRIAVAMDEAFCFVYEENLALLQRLGAQIVFFSPLRDQTLPPDIGGLYLPGGYPELHAEALSANRSLRKSIAAAVTGGLPTIAECGGFLYLHQMLDGVPMAGVIPADAIKGDRLHHFGYVSLRARRDNLLCKAGETIRGHEFHYYKSTRCGEGFTAEKPISGKSWDCVWANDHLYAGFPHLYLPSNPAFARSFLQKAADYKKGSSSC